MRIPGPKAVATFVALSLWVGCGAGCTTNNFNCNVKDACSTATPPGLHVQVTNGPKDR